MDFTLWRFCTALAGTMLLVLQNNMLAVGHDQQLPDENELWWTKDGRWGPEEDC